MGSRGRVGRAPSGGQGRGEAPLPEAEILEILVILESFLYIFIQKKWPKVKNLNKNLPPCLSRTAKTSPTFWSMGGGAPGPHIAGSATGQRVPDLGCHDMETAWTITHRCSMCTNVSSLSTEWSREQKGIEMTSTQTSWKYTGDQPRIQSYFISAILRVMRWDTGSQWRVSHNVGMMWSFCQMTVMTSTQTSWKYTGDQLVTNLPLFPT